MKQAERKKKIRQLIRALSTDPDGFDADGSNENTLVSCLYDETSSIELLRPLLSHNSAAARRTAAYAVGELTPNSCGLIRDIAVLVNDPNAPVRWTAMDSVLLCAKGNDVKFFPLLLARLSDPHDFVRERAMYLVANATEEQLSFAMTGLDPKERHLKSHSSGIKSLSRATDLDQTRIKKMLASRNRLSRKYGAMCAARSHSASLLRVASQSADPDIKKFGRWKAEELKIRNRSKRRLKAISRDKAH